jgi:hypothetical protein
MTRMPYVVEQTRVGLVKEASRLKTKYGVVWRGDAKANIKLEK